MNCVTFIKRETERERRRLMCTEEVAVKDILNSLRSFTWIEPIETDEVKEDKFPEELVESMAGAIEDALVQDSYTAFDGLHVHEIK
jgi:hypothetical protein